MITIYTTETCPRCKILKMKLDSKNIEYEENYDIDKLAEMNVMSVPQLVIDDKMMDFGEAISWVNSL